MRQRRFLPAVLCCSILTIPVWCAERGVATSQAAARAAAAEIQDAFAEVAEQALPAVVLITAQKRVGIVSPLDYQRSRVEYRELPSGQGSGFFIREDGYILTNFHVVRNQDSFWVTLHDGSEFPAEVVGADPPSDLALLKIESDRSFPFLKFADIDRVRIGHWAIAIGAPFSLSQSVTVGIVSGKKRVGVGVNLHEDYIQTDASVNAGNSGGPLLNLAGEVIGVNDFIMTPSGGSIGLSFAISADLASKVAEEMIIHGWVERPWLGAVIDQLNRTARGRLNLDHGIVIVRTLPDSPAREVLLAGDILLEADGQPLHTPGELQVRVYSSPPDSEIRFKLLREGEVCEVAVPLQSAPRNWFRRNARRQDVQAVAF